VIVPCEICDTYIAYELEDRGTSMVCGQCGGVTEIPTERVYPRVIIGNDFVVESEIAAGGMGTVYRAHQISLDVTVALKVLHPQFSNDPAFIEGFIKEARNAAQLNHPNIMFVVAVGRDLDVFYIAMEFIDGQSVKEMMGDGVIDVDDSVNIMMKVAAGLDHAWNEKQIVHRDLKPDNIMIRASDGAVKLADLGLASTASDIDYDDDDFNATPQYMCPEVLTFGLIDHRSDIYSLGATWYHMITGQFAFERDSPMEMVRAHVEDELTPPHLVNPNIPPAISSIICRMMAKEHEERYQTHGGLINSMIAYQEALARLEKQARQPKKQRSKNSSKPSFKVPNKAEIKSAADKTGPATAASKKLSRTAVRKSGKKVSAKTASRPVSRSAAKRKPAGRHADAVATPPPEPAKQKSPLMIGLAAGAILLILVVIIGLLTSPP
jgi:serine/threonine protein kinase